MRIAIVGVGLIGGSVGMAARRRLGADVVGFEPDARAANSAQLHGAIDRAAGSIAAAVQDADACFVAAPLAATAAAVDAALAGSPATCVVTDVGSTKRAIAVGREDERFVGGHPLAGGEMAGVEHAREDLFDGAVWYLTPTEATSGLLYERLHNLLTGLGARPTAVDPETHDSLMAAVSHLPHILANVLVAQATDALGGETLPPTGPSFRDATRVAGANPELWAQIYAANRDALAGQIDGAIARLRDVRERLDDLESWQAVALEQRRALLEVGLAGGPVRELRISVPNRPGVVADLALTLGRAGINISDMSLAPSADNRTGEVALWVGADDAPRAAELIAEKGLHVS